MPSQLERQQAELARHLLRRRAVLKGGAALAGAATLPALGRSALAAPAEPMQFIGWQYQPEIVAENVGIFCKLYDENVNYELVPGEYHAIAETKLIGGQHRHPDLLSQGAKQDVRRHRFVVREGMPQWPPALLGLAAKLGQLSRIDKVSRLQDVTQIQDVLTARAVAQEHASLKRAYPASTAK